MTGGASTVEPELDRGVALFNRRAYFQSHEIWEAAWHAAPEREKAFLGSLVQIATGLHLRFERGGSRGPRNLLVQAMLALESFRPEFLGVDVERLHRELGDYAKRLESDKGTEAGWLDRWLAPRIRAAR